MAQWIRKWTLNREVPGSNLLAVAVVPLGKALHPHCLVPQKGLKTMIPWLLAYKQLAFLVVSRNKFNYQLSNYLLPNYPMLTGTVVPEHRDRLPEDVGHVYKACILPAEGVHRTQA